MKSGGLAILHKGISVVGYAYCSAPDCWCQATKHNFERKSSIHYPCAKCGQDMLGRYDPECSGEKQP